MNRNEIRAAVLKLLARIAPEANVASLAGDVPIRRQIDLDSMDSLNVLAGLTEVFAIKVDEADYGRLQTIDDMVDYVAERRAAAKGLEMADYPVELERTRTLFDGRRVHIRPVRASDAEMEQDFVRHLSPDSRYTRFMVTMNELPAGKLKYLTDVDYEKHLALVATEQTGDGRQHQVGSARYVVDPGGKSCEFAIMVDDDWQSSGLAGMLMFTIMDVAHARGLESMEGLVLASNHKMLKFARQLGFSQQRLADDPGTVRVFRKL